MASILSIRRAYAGDILGPTISPEVAVVVHAVAQLQKALMYPLAEIEVHSVISTSVIVIFFGLPSKHSGHR